jgi:soluble lytic murein transglycosylase-like protein
MTPWLFLLPLDIISRSAKNYGLDPNLVAAIVMTESGGQTCATKYEAKYKYTSDTYTHADNTGITQVTEETHQKTSWGLMQVMGGLARELGHEGHLTELCDPVIGLNYGCKQIKRLYERYGSQADVISAYNQGSPRKNKGGLYENETYVDKVMRYYRELESI